MTLVVFDVLANRSSSSTSNSSSSIRISAVLDVSMQAGLYGRRFA